MHCEVLGKDVWGCHVFTLDGQRYRLPRRFHLGIRSCGVRVAYTHPTERGQQIQYWPYQSTSAGLLRTLRKALVAIEKLDGLYYDFYREAGQRTVRYFEGIALPTGVKIEVGRHGGLTVYAMMPTEESITTVLRTELDRCVGKMVKYRARLTVSELPAVLDEVVQERKRRIDAYNSSYCTTVATVMTPLDTNPVVRRNPSARRI